jgi:hypothetical protein
MGVVVHALHLSLSLPPRLELRQPPPPLPSKTSEITLPVLSVLPLSTSLWEGIRFDSQIPLLPILSGLYRWDQREVEMCNMQVETVALC